MLDSARADEAPFLADCWKAMLDELAALPGATVPRGFVPDWRDRLAGFFAAGLAEGRHGWFVARSADEKPVACAGALIAETSMIQVERIATIAGVYVEPAYRRRGLARRLTEAALEWARANGCTLARLTAGQPAEELYRAMGFTPGRELILPLSPLDRADRVAEARQ